MTTAQQFSELSQAYAAGNLSYRNRLINGNFDVWQRGSGPKGDGYLADRWNVFRASGPNLQQSAYKLTGAERALVGLNTWTALNIASDGVTQIIAQQGIEGVRTMQDTYATLSFWAWSDTGSNTISADVAQVFGSGGSPASAVFTPIVNLKPTVVGTTPTLVTGSLYIPSISGMSIGTNGGDAVYPRIFKMAGNANNLRIARVQFEPGLIVTPFELMPLGLTLAQCYRFFRFLHGSGMFQTSQRCSIGWDLCSYPMRGAGALVFGGTNQILDPDIAFYTVTGPSGLMPGNAAYTPLTINGPAQVGHSAIVIGGDYNNYIACDAEL